MEDEESDESAMLDEEECLLVTNRLHQVLRPFMLRRLKESVATELPPKVSSTLKQAGLMTIWACFVLPAQCLISPSPPFSSQASEPLILLLCVAPCDCHSAAHYCLLLHHQC